MVQAPGILPNLTGANLREANCSQNTVLPAPGWKMKLKPFWKRGPRVARSALPGTPGNTIMQASWAWAATLSRTRHIGDFANRAEPQAYQRAFDRLLHNLGDVNN